jgi:hypothetical protein
MKKLYRSLFVLYIGVLFLGVFTPRPDLVNPTSHPVIAPGPGVTVKTLHGILYYGGSWQWCGNFIMLMPLVFLLGKIVPQIKAQTLLLLSLLTTIFIEYTQIFIPGRVSDVRDITANGAGVLFFLTVKAFLGRPRV